MFALWRVMDQLLEFDVTLEDQKVASALLLRKIGKRMASAAVNAIVTTNCRFVLDLSIAFASAFRSKFKQRFLPVSLPFRPGQPCKSNLSIFASTTRLHLYQAHAEVLDGLDDSRLGLQLRKIGLH